MDALLSRDRYKFYRRIKIHRMPMNRNGRAKGRKEEEKRKERRTKAKREEKGEESRKKTKDSTFG